MRFNHQLRTYLWRLGYDIIPYSPQSHPLARRKQLLDSYNIDLVLDIGANAGQYAQELRNDLAYKNSIISFEPLKSAFKLLQANSAGDGNWDVYNFALGDAVTDGEINVADNSYSSSLLEMLPAHIESAPESKYVDKEKINIKTLDSIFSTISRSNNRIYMKIDTQGFESRVLKGAEKSLPAIDMIQMEMSLVPLYKGELLFNDLCLLMSEKGYSLVAVEPVFSDVNTGQMLQVDGIFNKLTDDLRHLSINPGNL